MLGGKGRGRLPSRPAASPTSWSCRRHPAPWGSPALSALQKQECWLLFLLFSEAYSCKGSTDSPGVFPHQSWEKSVTWRIRKSGQGGPSLRSLQGQALAPGAWLWAASRPPLSSDPRGSPGSAHRSPFSTARLQGEFEGDHPRQARTTTDLDACSGSPWDSCHMHKQLTKPIFIETLRVWNWSQRVPVDTQGEGAWRGGRGSGGEGEGGGNGGGAGQPRWVLRTREEPGTPAWTAEPQGDNESAAGKPRRGVCPSGGEGPPAWR